jgi:hypothetical protein
MNDPENGRGTFSRWSLVCADSSNTAVIASSNTRNHTFRSMDWLNALNAFVTEAGMVMMVLMC